MNRGDEPPASDRDERPGPGQFAETRWSKVVLAGQDPTPGAMRAKDELCAAYWSPIYGFLRRSGQSPQDAEDLTQQFFVRVLDSNIFSRAQPSKGRFRSFLLGALRHFLVDEARKAGALKRGGSVARPEIDLERAEELYLLEADSRWSPEEVFDRRWAATLLDAAYRRIEAEFESAQQGERFARLSAFLSERPQAGAYEKIAAELGMTTKAVGVAVTRLRHQYREAVRAVVADTLASSEDVEEEMRALFG